MRALVSIALICASKLCLANNTINQIHQEYCEQSGGQVEKMVVSYNTHSGHVYGAQKSFCTFYIDKGFVAVGLTSFASSTPNIAATLMKTMPEIDFESALFKGPYQNPSLNVCKNIGGSSVSFFVNGGGFANKVGQNDICVFGDGSMISAWSLIYIANGREGYSLVRDKVRSEPIQLSLPNTD